MCQVDAASMLPLLEDVAAAASFGPEGETDGHGELPSDPLTTTDDVGELSSGAASLLTTSVETDDHDDASEVLSSPAAELEDGDPSSSMPPDPVKTTQRGNNSNSNSKEGAKSRSASSSSISSKGSSSNPKGTPSKTGVTTHISATSNAASGSGAGKGQNQGNCFLQRKSQWTTQAANPVKKMVPLRDPSDRLRFLKERVERAIRERKIFVIHGCFPSIREALKSRGWMEKVECKIPKPIANIPGRTSPMPPATMSGSGSIMSTSVLTPHETETSIVSHLMKEAQANFVWNLRSDCADYWVNSNKEMIVSRLPRPHFTSKVGLCNYMKQMHWFCEDGVSHTLFPRCYNICQEEELSAFIQDFRMTACIGLIKWVVMRYDKFGDGGLRSPHAKIPISCVQFALRRCHEYIASRTHEDIDVDDTYSIVWEHQWDQYLTWYYRIVHDNALLLEAPDFNAKTAAASCKGMLVNLRQYWPQLQLDGYLNTWIMKPGNRCRGRGIQLVQRLEHVLMKVSPAVMKESRYVVQKYIERPLLIHETKFDIRQWFLVTSTHPLTVWMYRDSYIRFCSRPFSLKNLHESVHLCNNAVQCRYKNAKRDPSLPDENMWDNHTFKTYLRSIGHADAWDKIIYPGMRESLIGALLASQDSMAKRKNSFELFGADFMVTEDFLPWLIEINACPCMAPTTSVTARLCAQCLEDVIKVVIDRRYNRHAPTGMFELVYKQNIPPPPPYLGMALAVRGRNINRFGGTPTATRGNAQLKMRHSVPAGAKDKMHATKKNHKQNGKQSSKSSSYIGPIIVDLIEDLARHLDKTKCKKIRILSEKDMQNAAAKLVRTVEPDRQKMGDTKASPSSGITPVKQPSRPVSKQQTSRPASKATSGHSTPVHENRGGSSTNTKPTTAERKGSGLVKQQTGSKPAALQQGFASKPPSASRSGNDKLPSVDRGKKSDGRSSEKDRSSERGDDDKGSSVRRESRTAAGDSFSASRGRQSDKMLALDNTTACMAAAAHAATLVAQAITGGSLSPGPRAASPAEAKPRSKGPTSPSPAPSKNQDTSSSPSEKEKSKEKRKKTEKKTKEENKKSPRRRRHRRSKVKG